MKLSPTLRIGGTGGALLRLSGQSGFRAEVARSLDGLGTLSGVERVARNNCDSAGGVSRFAAGTPEVRRWRR